MGCNGIEIIDKAGTVGGLVLGWSVSCKKRISQLWLRQTLATAPLPEPLL